MKSKISGIFDRYCNTKEQTPRTYRQRARTPIEIKRKASLHKNINESDTLHKNTLKEVKVLMEELDNAKDTSNIPLLKLLQESLINSNLTEENKILISLKQTKEGILEVVVDKGKAMKVVLKEDNVINLVYDTVQRKLKRQETDNDSVGRVLYEKSTLDTNNEDMLSSLRQNIGVETPNFSTNTYKLFKKNDQIQDSSIDNKYKDLIYNLANTIHSLDVSNTEGMHRMFDGLNKINDCKQKVKELYEVYGRVLDKIHKVLPVSSRVLHNLMNTLLSLIDQLLSEKGKSLGLHSINDSTDIKDQLDGNTTTLSYSMFIKIMDEFMSFLTKNNLIHVLPNNEICYYHWFDSTNSLFNRLLLYFFIHKSANPFTEYKSFMQTLLHGKSESHLLLKATCLFNNGLPIVDNYFFQFYLQIYGLLKSYVQRVPLYGLLKVGFSVFEDYLESNTMSLFLYFLSKIYLYTGNGQLMNSWEVLVTLLGVQSEPVMDKVKEINENDLGNFINTLNTLEIYLPSKNFNKDNEQLQVLLNTYKENVLGGEISVKRIIINMEEAFIEGPKVYCTALDAAAMLTLFAEAITEKLRSNDVSLLLSHMSSKGHSSKEFLEFIYLEIQQNHKNVRKHEALAKKWLPHFIFKNLYAKLNTFQ